MPKILLAHPTQSPYEQLMRYYAGLALAASKPGREDLSADEVVALCVFADLPCRTVENPLLPDELALEPLNPYQLVRESPDGPLLVVERHAVNLEAAREALSVRLVDGTVN